MVQYRYLGYGVTNEDGIAKLDHDPQGNPLSHSYTGVGAGKVDIVASLDDEIDDSSLVSETYSIIDAKYICGTNELSISSNTQQVHNETQYDLSLVNLSNYGFAYLSTNNGSTAWIYITENSSVEFEVLAYTGTVTIRFDGSTSNDNIFTINRTGKYRIMYEGATTKVYIDNQLITTVNTSNESKQPRWRINSNSTISLKDIMYY